jgi:hypothetical protein
MDQCIRVCIIRYRLLFTFSDKKEFRNIDALGLAVNSGELLNIEVRII